MLNVGVRQNTTESILVRGIALILLVALLVTLSKIERQPQAFIFNSEMRHQVEYCKECNQRLKHENN